MKRTLLCCTAMAVLCATACTKNRNFIDEGIVQPSAEVTHQVTLNVSGFGQQVTNYSSSATRSGATSSAKQMAGAVTATIPADVAKISYSFSQYNEKTKTYISYYDESQTKATAGTKFGQFTHRFVPGKYRVMVYAGSADGSIVSGNSANAAVTFQNDKLVTPELRKESYYQVFEITVGEDDVNSSLTLNRGNGKLIITLTDEWLSDYAKVTIGMDAKYSYKLIQDDPITIDGKTSYTRSVLGEDEMPVTFKTKSGATMTYYMPLNTNESFLTSIIIKGYNADGVEMKRKVIDSVLIQNNKVTTVSGAFFKLATTPISISFPTDYGDNINKSF